MSISCLICLDNFETSTEVVSINRCGHVFHMECLNEWRSSKKGLSNTCPLCRKTFNKRSLTKLFLGVAESEQDFKKDLQKLEEEKTREECEKQKYMNELYQVKTELGIKNQAYHIIDSVNTEYLHYNQKLKQQNEKLLAESNRIREEMENLKKKLHAPPPPLIDLTSGEISEDDEIQFVSATKIEKVSEVVLINDEDDDDVQVITDSANKTENEPQPEVSQISDERTIQPIETVDDATEQRIVEKIQEIPFKIENNVAGVSAVKSEEPLGTISDNYHLTFGDAMPADQSIIKEIQEIPFKIEGMSDGNHQAPFYADNEIAVKSEEPLGSIPDNYHLTFGDAMPADQVIVPELDDDEPLFKKPRFFNENDYSLLQEYFMNHL